MDQSLSLQAENITTYIQTLDIHSNIHNMYTQKALIGNEMWRNCKVTYSRQMLEVNKGIEVIKATSTVQNSVL